jgi:hypothetical protein
MKSASAMTEFRPSKQAPLLDDAAVYKGIRDGMLVGLVLFTLVRSGEALAGDQAALDTAAVDPDSGNSRQSAAPAAPAAPARDVFTAPPATDIQSFSATEFRPRKRTLFDKDPTDFSLSNTPMLHGTSVWERLAEYKSNDGVRLLTVWESKGSTVSLQASNHGGPSLQWSSRSMNHGAPKRGLLDRFFSVSLGGNGMGTNVRSPARPAIAPAAAKPAAAPAVSGQQ